MSSKLLGVSHSLSVGHHPHHTSVIDSILESSSDFLADIFHRCEHYFYFSYFSSPAAPSRASSFCAHDPEHIYHKHHQQHHGDHGGDRDHQHEHEHTNSLQTSFKDTKKKKSMELTLSEKQVLKNVGDKSKTLKKEVKKVKSELKAGALRLKHFRNFEGATDNALEALNATKSKGKAQAEEKYSILSDVKDQFGHAAAQTGPTALENILAVARKVETEIGEINTQLQDQAIKEVEKGADATTATSATTAATNKATTATTKATTTKKS